MIRPTIAVICTLFVATSLFAQGGAPLKTGQKYVTAIVDHGSGWVQVKVFPGNTIDGSYSYPQKSFVSFNVGGKVFTNNDVGLAPLPANTFMLKDGILKKIGDTIRCVWPNKDGFDLIQDIYPVLFERSEQIVFRWKAFNKNSTSASIAVQYLLDVMVGDDNIVNDGSPILTRYGYRPNWDVFTTSTGTGVPWFYATFQHKLPNSPTFDPGLTGVGYTDNTFANLGLTKPFRQTIGDWNKLIEVRWGPPTPLPNGQYTDAATLFEFNGATAIPNKETPLAATSYGTGEFATCRGQLFGIVFYPLRINWEPPNLVPYPFPVEMYLFNPQSVQGAPNTKVTLTVGTDLTITSPTPITNSGKRQQQEIQVGGFIPPLGVGIAQWTLQASKSTQCNGEIVSSLRFAAESPGLGYPIFVNEVDGSDTCEHPIIIECASPLNDKQPPILDPFVTTANGDKEITAHDDRIDIDTGLRIIKWTYKSDTDSSKFTISVTPPVVACSKAKHTVTLHQIDSVIGGCIDLTFEDCAGNKKDTTVCFESKTYVPPDTLPPLTFDHVTINKRKKEFKVLDNRTDDTGIKEALYTVREMDSAHVDFIPPLDSASKVVHVVVVTQTDTLHYGCVVFQISDYANNVTLDTICFTKDTSLAVGRNTTDAANFQILGNPSSGKATILLTLESAQDITLRIVDPLGREVRRVDVKGLSQGENLIPLSTSEFASGTYYLTLEIDGKQFAKMLKVVR